MPLLTQLIKLFLEHVRGPCVDGCTATISGVVPTWMHIQSSNERQRVHRLIHQYPVDKAELRLKEQERSLGRFELWEHRGRRMATLLKLRIRASIEAIVTPSCHCH